MPLPRLTPSRPRSARSRLASLLVAGGAVAMVATTAAPAHLSASAASPPATDSVAVAATADGAAPRAAGNPLAGRRWGVYQGNMDQAWPPYANATGRRKELLGRIALQPRSKWFGSWIAPGQIDDKVRDYVTNAQAGDRSTLVQMAFFNMSPWEQAACRQLPSEKQQDSYRRWIASAAEGIGDAHVALVLQPDGPFALCAPQGSKVYSRLIRYAARTLGALPHTSVYIDAGASDWLRDNPRRAARILIPAGVRHVRGFAINSTHYVSTAREIRFGAETVRYLSSRGITGKRFIINTSSNGRPFAGYTYDGPDFNHARVCRSMDDRRCVTLGIPPTTDVANPAWGLSEQNRALAARYVDAYMWFGRPWLYRQADPFDLERALQLVRTTPF